MIKARASVKVEVHLKEFNDFFNNDAEIQGYLKAFAEGVMGAAIDASPVGHYAWDPKVRWYYRVSKSEESFKRHWRVRRYRNHFIVENTDRFAFLVEYGSNKNPAYAPLRTAARSSGGRFEELTKAQYTGEEE